MTRIASSRTNSTKLRMFGMGASAIAIMVATQPLTAQTASEQAAPPKPAGSGAPGPSSGNPSVDDATAGTAPGSAGSISGSTGSSPQSEDTPPDTETDEIVVTGVRQSLANAQNIKRNADTIVDAITAEDIGALPDRSVNEALQRVPGVAISRFAAPNDSQHYSAQGSGVIIRGLNYVRGEFNGRDAFAAGGGREIGFNDIPSEIVGSIEVYKNLTADLIEGGIAGNVNINTRKPFDNRDDVLFLSGGLNYGDLAERASPQAVALVSKQWDMASGGRFGILGSLTYQRIRSRADSVFTASFLPRFNDDTNGNGTQDAGEGRAINAGTGFARTLFDTFPVPAGQNRVYVPLGAGSRTQDFDRNRIGYSGSVQFENADRNFLITGQFLRAESKEEWVEHTIEPNNYYNDVTAIFPAAGTSFTFDEDGVFTSGILTKPNNGDAQGFRPDGSYGILQFDPNGGRITQSNRHFYSKSITQDQSINVKWEPTERLHLNFDGQFVTSKVKVMDDILDTSTFAGVSLDLRESIPQIGFTVPGGDTAGYFANPDQIYFRDAFNGRQDNDGEEYALRADAQYDVSEESFLRNVRLGARYADRKQTVRQHDYTNWGNLSETWASGGPVTFADAPAGSGQLYNFTNFFRGDAATPPSAFFVPNEIVSNHDAFTDLLRRITAQGGGSYRPLEDRGTDLIKGVFLPNEIFRNSEKTFAAYVRADFGIDDFGNGMSLSGNVGVRYVNTRDSSLGALTFPNQGNIFTPDTNNPPRYNTLAEYCAFTIANRATTGATGPLPPICTVTPAQQNAILAFSNGASIPDNARQKFDFFLPSANIKLEITPQILLRAAGSKAISRPNFGDLRNYVGLGTAGGNSTGNFGFQGSSRNPFLRPIEATQFDLSAEWYFAKVGSITGAVFHKTLDNIIVDNFGFTRTVTNNGQTFDVGINGPANVSGKAKIKGAEIAYQQTYDFLPGKLRGLGLQANYTYIDAGRIPNGVPNNADNDGNRPPQDVTGIYDNLSLAGLSKHNANIAGFYDLGGFYARVAYSWRSKFLLTNRDCCFPYLPVYSLATGQLDASAFYTVNKNFKLGITAQNLLDETTKTTFLLNGEGLEAPRSFFKNDRSFTISASITY